MSENNDDVEVYNPLIPAFNEMKRDALRYRWFRSHVGFSLGNEDQIGNFQISRKINCGEVLYYYNEELDSVIDEEIAEDFKVNNVIEDLDNNDLDVSSCPFCGKEVDLEDGDTLYPTGSGWRDNEVEGFRTYHRRMEVPREQWCWSMHCPIASGGCGAEMHGDSRDEAIAKWNHRV